MITIHDVAERAAVSAQTVSRVLRNHPSVRPYTRRIVLQAMEELGYLPNSTARNLRTARSHTIGLVVADLGNPAYQSGIKAIEGVVRGRGYSLLICDSDGDAEAEAANLRELFQRRVEGLIILNTLGQPRQEVALFLRAKIPLLEIRDAKEGLGIPAKFIDVASAFRQAMAYLAELGHRRIALVTGKLPPVIDRADYYRDALVEAGLPYDPSLLYMVTTAADCREAIESMFSAPSRPTAVVSGYHALAPHLLSAIHRAGLKIPRDVSFITMGESPWTRACDPPITVVAYNASQHYRLTAEYIFARLDGQEGTELLAETQAVLIVRDSCAPPAAAAERTAGRI